MKKNVIWSDWVNLALGAWVFLVPWVISYRLPDQILFYTIWNFWIVGAIIFASAALAIQNLRTWKKWTTVVAGTWLFLSPWMIGYETQSALLWNSVVVGFLVSVLTAMTLPVVRMRHPYAP